MHGFEDTNTGKEHVALVLGNVADEDSVLCRVHSECLTVIVCSVCDVIVVPSFNMLCKRYLRRVRV